MTSSASTQNSPPLLCTLATARPAMSTGPSMKSEASSGFVDLWMMTSTAWLTPALLPLVGGTLTAMVTPSTPF